jgi:hypothetical protein
LYVKRSTLIFLTRSMEFCIGPSDQQ